MFESMPAGHDHAPATTPELDDIAIPDLGDRPGDGSGQINETAAACHHPFRNAFLESVVHEIRMMRCAGAWHIVHMRQPGPDPFGERADEGCVEALDHPARQAEMVHMSMGGDDATHRKAS